MRPTNLHAEGTATDAHFLALVLGAATDPSRKAAILRAAATGSDKVHMGTAREAAQILGTCSRTVERYARAGCFSRVHLSPRKVRYPLHEVEAFAQRGIEGT